ncbi:MAG: hypothetical protein K8R85_00645 [Bacteroidetes bacterium]|nr:hypothetical protein [Bacteroidota bacterium]
MIIENLAIKAVVEIFAIICIVAVSLSVVGLLFYLLLKVFESLLDDLFDCLSKAALLQTSRGEEVQDVKVKTPKGQDENKNRQKKLTKPKKKKKTKISH